MAVPRTAAEACELLMLGELLCVCFLLQQYQGEGPAASVVLRQHQILRLCGY